MGFLDTLDPTQRRILTIGAPVAVAAGVAGMIRRRQAAAKPADRTGAGAETDGSTGPPVGYTLPAMPSTDAIGVGQLAEFETALTGAITGLASQFAAAQASPPPTWSAPPGSYQPAAPPAAAADLAVPPAPPVFHPPAGAVIDGDGNYALQTFDTGGGVNVLRWTTGGARVQ